MEVQYSVARGGAINLVSVDRSLELSGVGSYF